MRIIGIDVGFAINGWSIVESAPMEKNKMKLIDYGAIFTDKDEAMEARLLKVFNDLNEVMDHYSPDTMAIENIFFFKNQKTVINVGQVRGIILLAAKMRDLDIYHYTPLQVKTAVTGYGRAEKKQIQRMTQLIFGLKEVPKPDDAADAIAIAVCHLNSVKYNALTKK